MYLQDFIWFYGRIIMDYHAWTGHLMAPLYIIIYSPGKIMEWQRVLNIAHLWKWFLEFSALSELTHGNAETKKSHFHSVKLHYPTKEKQRLALLILTSDLKPLLTRRPKLCCSCSHSYFFACKPVFVARKTWWKCWVMCPLHRNVSSDFVVLPGKIHIATIHFLWGYQ